MTTLTELGLKAKAAARVLSISGADTRNEALKAIAAALEENVKAILAANDEDITLAKASGMADSMVDRLRLSEKRIMDIATATREIVFLPDPIGKTDYGTTRPNGLVIYKTRVPLGVIGIIYEARPNVTVDAAALCLKSGNAVILRGGKEAIKSNTVLVKVMREALLRVGLPEDCVALVEDTSRESANEMMRMNEYLDVLIPRGGAGLIKSVVENSSVPVIQTGVGNCHVYLDKDADYEKAVNIAVSAKISRPSVCNAEETLLVHKDVAEKLLPDIAKKLLECGVEIRGCDITQKILGSVVTPATPLDWETEYNDYILAVKVVNDIDEAIEHIAKYGTMHSEAIITENITAAHKFTRMVDAAAVYVNASTRFTDGGKFGLGAEIGISNQKLHARGPMGVGELTTVKYIIEGSGQTC